MYGVLIGVCGLAVIAGFMALLGCTVCKNAQHVSRTAAHPLDHKVHG